MSREHRPLLPADQGPPNRTCPRCGAPFTCHAETAPDRCWCLALPPLSDPQPGEGCLCPRCLSRQAGEPRSDR